MKKFDIEFETNLQLEQVHFEWRKTSLEAQMKNSQLSVIYERWNENSEREKCKTCFRKWRSLILLNARNLDPE